MKLTYREDDQQNPSIFWINPWNQQEEKIASLYWPTHPPDKTEEVEKMWAEMGDLFASAYTWKDSANYLNGQADMFKHERDAAIRWSSEHFKDSVRMAGEIIDLKLQIRDLKSQLDMQRGRLPLQTNLHDDTSAQDAIDYASDQKKEIESLRDQLSAALAAKAEAEKEQPINTSLRLFDLVRVMRGELLHAGLIDEEEYAWLLHGSDMATSPKGGSPSRARQEEYDELRARLTAVLEAGEQLESALHGRTHPTRALAAWSAAKQ